MTSRDDIGARRSRAIRSAVVLVLVAVLVYATFIFMQYQRSRGLM